LVRLEASTGETRKLNGFEWGNLRDRGHLELLGADRNIILMLHNLRFSLFKMPFIS
jgi:hypothetical protein